MPASNDTIVVGLGEFLWDELPDGRRPGGAPANVAFHATQLGLRGIVCSRIGDDADGAELRATIEAAGLPTDELQVDDELPTGTVTIDAVDPEDPQYTIHEPVAWDALQLTPRLRELAGRCHAVCFGTLAQRSERSRRTIGEFLDAAPRALRVYDVNLRQDWYTRGTIEQSLRRATIVKLNLGELDTLAGMFELGGDGPVARARALLERSEATMAAVTRGGDGCLLVTREASHDEPGAKVEVADAVGAGDAFTAGMIAARLGGFPLDATARVANSIGGVVASHHGAMPGGLGEEFAAVLARHAPAGDPPRGD